MSYLPRSSPLHAAGAAVAISWCAALLVSTLVSDSPIWLGCVLITVCGAGALAQIGSAMRGCLRLALPLALTICVINALVTRSGLTVIWRFGELPILGQTDVTLQATVYGAALGLRAVAIILIATFYTAAVDADQVLRLFRRWSFSSGLSAAVATRMVPVLIRDGHRLADAQRCRPGPPAGRRQLLQATASGAIDRALDVAATLEVRGYALARGTDRRGVGGSRPALSGVTRQDLAFLASALAVVSVSVGARIAQLIGFSAYPQIALSPPLETVAAASAVACCALVPFLQRRGLGRG